MIDLERLAREAGMSRDGQRWFTDSSDPLDAQDVTHECLQRFAQLVAEEAARVVEAKKVHALSYFEIDERLQDCAAAIREAFGLEKR